MNPKLSSLFRLFPHERVECVCSVCDEIDVGFARDQQTGGIVCPECVPFALAAEQVMRDSMEVSA